jgi:hypothetical protein
LDLRRLQLASKVVLGKMPDVSKNSLFHQVASSTVSIEVKCDTSVSLN